MNKRGFTLIELLAVIVILAIIAVIAVPIVLNIIDETKNNAGLRSAEMYVKAAELSIANSTLKDINIPDGEYNLKDGDICLNEACTDKLEVEVNGKVPESGTITITNGNISGLSIVLNEKTIVKNSEGKLVYQDGENNLQKTCTYVDSEDDTGDAVGTIDLSDIVTCGTESFYVMKNDGTEITMLSKYNLNVGDKAYTSGTIGIQNKNVLGGGSDTYGGIAFSTTEYWKNSDDYSKPLPQYGNSYPAYVYDSNSNLYQYVNEYERILKEDLKVSTAVATLINLDQLEGLGCYEPYDEYSDYINCSNAPSWLHSTYYWTGVASKSFVCAFYSESGNSDCGSVPSEPYMDYNGIRPVITISTSEIQ